MPIMFMDRNSLRTLASEPIRFQGKTLPFKCGD